jgi:glycerol transport system substrate-binding protein
MSRTIYRGGLQVPRRAVLKGATALGLVAGMRAPFVWAQDDQQYRDAAARWIDSEFQPSTLSRDEQMAEMEFFIRAAAPFRGQDINVVSETITTHEYEAGTLARAFSEITGINLKHDLIQEGDVIERLQTQMQSGRNVYDAYVNDSDLIGTHSRYGAVVPLSDFITAEGRDFTLPTLDIDDFIGKSFTTGPDGKLYQLPDQPAVRQPLLVPPGLVPAARAAGAVPQPVRLRAGRADQLVGL